MDSSQLVKCPLCDKQVRARGYLGHLRLSHPNPDTRGESIDVLNGATESAELLSKLTDLSQRVKQLEAAAMTRQLKEEHVEETVGNQLPVVQAKIFG